MTNPTITICGRLTRDPELKFAASGTAIANLSIATSDSRKTDTGWEDVDTSFWDCTAFKQTAEAAADQLHKGMAVVAVGRIKQRSYETREGEKRTVVEVALDSIGPDLRWAKPAAKTAPVRDDPWATPASTTNRTSAANTEVPF